MNKSLLEEIEAIQKLLYEAHLEKQRQKESYLKAMQEIKNNPIKITCTPNPSINNKETLINNFRKIYKNIVKHQKYIIEFHLKRIKELCGIESANLLIAELDLKTHYKIKPFKK